MTANAGAFFRDNFTWEPGVEADGELARAKLGTLRREAGASRLGAVVDAEPGPPVKPGNLGRGTGVCVCGEDCPCLLFGDDMPRGLALRRPQKVR